MPATSARRNMCRELASCGFHPSDWERISANPAMPPISPTWQPSRLACDRESTFSILRSTTVISVQSATLVPCSSRWSSPANCIATKCWSAPRLAIFRLTAIRRRMRAPTFIANMSRLACSIRRRWQAGCTACHRHILKIRSSDRDGTWGSKPLTSFTSITRNRSWRDVTREVFHQRLKDAFALLEKLVKAGKTSVLRSCDLERLPRGRQLARLHGSF